MSGSLKIPSVVTMGGMSFIGIGVPFPTPFSPCPNSQWERIWIILT